MTRLIFTLDDDVHSKFKAHCATKKMSMTKELVRLIKREIGYSDAANYPNYKQVWEGARKTS